jgi:hypothetical protein
LTEEELGVFPGGGTVLGQGVAKERELVRSKAAIALATVDHRVVTFHLQTRLNPGTGNDIDILPSGTVLCVKILDSIDSAADRDGSEFHGLVVSPVLAGKITVLHADSEVRGIFVLLRSRNHPEGFRYELLITGINDRGKNYNLTASLNPSFRETSEPSAAASNTEIKGVRKDTVPATSKLPVPLSN